MRNQRGPCEPPNRSGLYAPVTKLSRRWPFGIAIFAVAQWRIFSALIRFWQSLCCSVKLLRLRQVTWESTDDNLTPVRNQRGPCEPPNRSGLYAPVTKLSRRWPFGIAIFAVAQWRIFSALIRFWQSLCCSVKLLRLRQVTWKSTDVNPSIVWSQKGPKGPLIEQGNRTLW